MRNLIFGTLLGDGNLCLDRTIYRFSVGHAQAQLPYLMWKAKYLGIPEERIHSHMSGYGSKMYEFRYYDAPFLREIAGICLRNGVKTVTPEWLDELDDLSLAVWYQDDGSWGRDASRAKNGDRYSRYVTFSTEGFDLGSVQMLRDWLIGRGYSAVIRRSKGKYWVITLNHSSTIRLWETIAPYLVIKTKIDTRERPGIGRCACGALIEPKMRICHECVWKKAMLGKCHRPQLTCRFGTSSLGKLKQMTVKNPPIKRYWVDLSRIGCLVD